MRMKPWFKKVLLDIEYFDNQIAIEMKVDDSYIKELILQLMALNEELINKINLQSTNFSLKITMNKNLEPGGSICSLLNREEPYPHFIFSKNELEYCIYFLLESYMGKYNHYKGMHIDIDLYLNDPNKTSREVIFTVQKVY